MRIRSRGLGLLLAGVLMSSGVAVGAAGLSPAAAVDEGAASLARPTSALAGGDILDVAASGAAGKPTVLDSGSLSLTPKFSSDSDLSACTSSRKCYPSGSVAGLLDKTTYDEAYAAAEGLIDQDVTDAQPWYAADDVVIHVPERADGYTLPRLEAGSGDYVAAQVEGTAQTPAEYLANEAPDNLLLGANLGRNSHSLNYAYAKSIISGAGHLYSLAAVTKAPADGMVTAQLDEGSASLAGDAAWDSSKPSTAWEPITSGGDFGGDVNVPWAWNFSRPGVYCLAITESPRLKATDTEPSRTLDATGTFTFVVGDTVDPTTVSTCPQWSGDGDGGSGDPETTTVVTDTAHHDLRVYGSNTQLTFGMDASLRTPLRDLVWANTPAPSVVKEPTDTVDMRAVGPVGTKYWYFPNTDGLGTPWPGISAESLAKEDYATPPTLRLLGFSRDGVANPAGVNVALLSTVTSSARSHSYFNTRLGLPQATELAPKTHFHPYWTFTQPGVYCLAIGATAQRTDGTTVSGTGQITMVVGDASDGTPDPSTVTPCERNGEPLPVATAKSGVPAVDAHGVHVLGDENDYLELGLQDDKLAAVAETSSSVDDTPAIRDPEDVITTTGQYDAQHEAWVFGRAGEGSLALDLTSLDPDALGDGTATVTLGEVDGPGVVTTENSNDWMVSTALSSAAGGNRSFTTVGQNTVDPWWWYFSKAGVYCVPLTLSATLKGGAETSVAKTLTFVAGNLTDPAAADYIDPSAVTTCSRGQHGQAAANPSTGDGGDGTVPHDDIYVSNGSTTDSGAVILNNGHVDLASTVEGDTLETWVKDSTVDGTDPAYHPVAGSTSLDSGQRGDRNNGNATVFQLLPEAKTTVPDASAYSFLGKPGDPVWQVTQTQQPGLLWPGWSTEDIASTATQTGVQWTLDKSTGPGDFALYLSDPANLGAQDVLFNTRDGIDAADSFDIGKQAHVHGSWAFSAEGTYCLGFTRSTTMADGTAASDDFTLAVAVGRVDVRKVDPGVCFAGDNGGGNGDGDAGNPPPSRGGGQGTDTGTGTKTAVVQAAPVVRIAKVRRTHHGRVLKVRVKVSAAGVAPSGKVRVKIAGRGKTVRLRHGHAVVKIKLGKKLGKRASSHLVTKKLKVRYLGDARVAAGQAHRKVKLRLHT